MGSTLESTTRSLLLDGAFRNLQSLDQMMNVIEEQDQALSAHTEPCAFPSSDYLFQYIYGQREVLEGVRTSLRQMFNTLANPMIRPLQITDLPDEILVQIFEQVRGWEWEDMDTMIIDNIGSSDTGGADDADDAYEPDDANSVYMNDASSKYLYDTKAEEFQDGVRSIQHIRLTCRKFCEVSSHLLIPSLYVEMQPHSLARLEEISQHPTIGVGVRTVRALLPYYDGDQAINLDVFGARAYAIVEAELGSLRNRRPPNVPEKRWRTLVDIGKAAAEGFINVTDDEEPSDIGDPRILKYQSLLRKAKEEYQSRFEEQEALRRDGNFSRRVAAAMARLPVARRLEFHDIRSCAQKLFQLEKIEDDDHLFQMLLQPTEWCHRNLQDPAGPPIEIIPELPVYLYRAGVQLSTLTIDIQINQFTSLMERNIDTAEMRAAFQGLKAFTYRPKLDRGWVDSQPTDFQPVHLFLRSVLDTASMRRICWEHQLIFSQIISELDFGSVITFRPWPHLEYLSLRRVALHLGDLRAFLRRACSPALRELHLDRVYLLGGTWAEVLDVLRAADLSLKSVWFPSDPEGEAITRDSDAFRPDYPGSSPANRYISGFIDQNPLLTHDD